MTVTFPEQYQNDKLAGREAVLRHFNIQRTARDLACVFQQLTDEAE